MAINKTSDAVVMSREALQYLAGLINKIVSAPEQLIDDVNLQTVTTFSSVRLNSLINETLQDAKDYTDEICGALVKLTCEKTTTQPTLGNSQKNIIYLYSADGNPPFEQYLKISDTELIDMGSTSISLNDYLTITDAVATYCKKTDFDALKTEVDKVKTTLGTKVDKTDIVDNLTSTDTDKPLSANQGKVLKDEVDLKANDNEVIKKIDITTIINSSSTDTQVPSAKSVYDNVIKDNNIKTYTSLDQLGLTAGSETLQDIAKAMVDGSIAIIPIINGVNQSLYPATFGNLIVYRGNNNRIDFMFYPTTDHVMSSKSKYGLVYVCSYHITKDLLFGWQRICTTSVNNVPTTKITLDSSIFSDGDVYYEVKNGVCYVSIRGLIPVKTGTSLLVSDSMPKPNYYILQTLSLGNTDTLPTTPITARIEVGETKLVIHSNNNTKALYGSFSYPVAES